jgi:hypothetical protein
MARVLVDSVLVQSFALKALGPRGQALVRSLRATHEF